MATAQPIGVPAAVRPAWWRRLSPASLALSKRLLWADVSLEETIRRESGYHLLLMGTPDAAEGPRAWMERRDPQWTLRTADLLDRGDLRFIILLSLCRRKVWR